MYWQIKVSTLPATDEGTSWWAQNVKKCVYSDYVHTDRLGSVVEYSYDSTLGNLTHGYTDFHDLTPSVETGIDKPEVVRESYVVDYTTAIRETLTMHEDGGFD